MKSNKPVSVRLIYPHQLFIEHTLTSPRTIMVMIEDDLFFKQYPFHKQKLMLHRASMRHFAEMLRAKGFDVLVIETSDEASDDALRERLKELNVSDVSYFELTDEWLERRLKKITYDLKLTTKQLNSPGFLTSAGLIDEYFENNPNRMQYFYEWQRKRLHILVEGTKPIGGKWSFDMANRKKLPKNVTLPDVYTKHTSTHANQAKTWVDGRFPHNPGNSHSFAYAVTHEHAEAQLHEFISQRLNEFGPYEDSIAQDQSQLFHSVLSPLLNIGLLTPQQVIDAVMKYSSKHDIPIESLEGFIRQVIGWREYMRATYIRYGSKMRMTNHLNFDRSLSNGWWNGSTGLEPIDNTIRRVLDTGYAHHIERLMVLGNAMVLMRIHPDDVYVWFMSLFIDAFDWVMVPNVYAMSQFAAGEMITTKPYISSSNYIVKMSDYKKDHWSETWDALYWQFISDHREIIEKNYRTRMIVSLYDRFDNVKKDNFSHKAAEWLN